ncbi:MAG: BON domain-containing protein [Gaiellaceae bacterium]
MPLFLLAGAIGAAAAYFLDPDNGRRRRKQTVDRGAGFVRRRSREAVRLGRGVASEAHGVKQKVAHRKEQPKDLDDVTLARKVETEIFRAPDMPKGKINVNVEEGVVVLRGEADQPELIDELVEKARSVQGVRDVKNLLHLPNTPAPTES